MVLRFELGSGTATLRSPEAYADGRWHAIEATRVENEAVLKVRETKRNIKL